MGSLPHSLCAATRAHCLVAADPPPDSSYENRQSLLRRNQQSMGSCVWQRLERGRYRGIRRRGGGHASAHRTLQYKDVVEGWPDDPLAALIRSSIAARRG